MMQLMRRFSRRFTTAWPLRPQHRNKGFAAARATVTRRESIANDAGDAFDAAGAYLSDTRDWLDLWHGNDADAGHFADEPVTTENSLSPNL
jgi:hypothetical protein